MTTETKTQTKALTPIDEVRGALAKMEPQFKMALPAQVSPEKFVRVAMTAVQQNPALLTADRQSLYGACMRAAQDGLLVDDREAAITMFGKAAVYMPMVGGILKKVRNSGELGSITSQIVHKNDKFRYWVDGDGEHIEHEPLMFGERGEAIGVYALAKTKDGAVYIEVMDKAAVMAIRGASRAKDSGPWAGAFEHEMWRKSAIRRLSKRLPMSTDLEQVIHRDDELYDFKATEEKPVEPQTKPTRLGKIIEATVTKAEPEKDQPEKGKAIQPDDMPNDAQAPEDLPL